MSFTERNPFLWFWTTSLWKLKIKRYNFRNRKAFERKITERFLRAKREFDLPKNSRWFRISRRTKRRDRSFREIRKEKLRNEMRLGNWRRYFERR